MSKLVDGGINIQKTTILEANSYFGGILKIEFSETGYKVVEDTTQGQITRFLGISEESAGEITEACRDQIIKYMFQRKKGLPALGATPQQRYFKGLNPEDLERIGKEDKNT